MPCEVLPVAYSWWDVLKDTLGTIGAVLVTLPWLFDFRLRLRRERTRDLRNLSGSIETLRRDMLIGLVDSIERPRWRDFTFTLLGLCLIVASFAIGLIHGLFELLA